MNSRSVFFSVIAVAIVLLSVQTVEAQKQERGIVGQVAPKWDVSAWHQLPAGQKSLDVTDYRGKVTYLYFFQSWCPGCHSAGFPTLQELTKKFKDDPEVAFAAIQTTFEGHHVNTAEKLNEMASRYELKIPFGQSAGDEGTPEIMRKYRTGGTPWIVIIDKQGRVRFNGFRIQPEAAAKGIEQLKLETSEIETDVETAK